MRAPNCIAGIDISAHAPQVRRPVADAGRWAALSGRGSWLFGLCSVLWHP
jgi:hypothetical protein